MIARHTFCITLLGLFCSTVQAGEGFDWPGWRGPDRTAVSKEKGLLKSWPQGGPKKLWTYSEAGLGYSGFAVVDGKIYTMGARGDKEFLIVLDAEQGTEAWNLEIGDKLNNGWGDGPRGTPTVDGDLVFVLSGRGNLVCISMTQKKALWSKGMKELGGSIPKWGYSESVLVDGDKVICTPGGSQGALAALEKRSGNLIWQSKDVPDEAQYSSIVVAEVHGERQYIQLFMSSLVGVAANSGKLLWKTDWPGRTAVIPTPIFHDDMVYITSGYGVGCKLVRLESGNKAEEVYANRHMKNHHGGVVLVGDHLYGYSDQVGWVCQNFKTGEIVWSERSKLGKGCLTCADGKLYCMDERGGNVVLIDASPDGWKEHGRFVLEPQSKQRSQRGAIWTHPVIVNGKLYLRDQDIICCYDVQAK